MNSKNVIIFSLSFVIIGFFSSGFLKVEVNADALAGGNGNIAKVEERLNERIDRLEENMTTSEENREPDSIEEKKMVRVAYLMSKYKFLNARADAGVNFPVIEKVQPDSPMEIIDTKDKWYRVKLESGNLAWVASWVVDVKDEYK